MAKGGNKKTKEKYFEERGSFAGNEMGVKINAVFKHGEPEADDNAKLDSVNDLVKVFRESLDEKKQKRKLEKFFDWRDEEKCKKGKDPELYGVLRGLKKKVLIQN